MAPTPERARPNHTSTRTPVFYTANQNSLGHYTPRTCTRILFLHEEEGLGYKAIGRKMNMARTSVRNIVHRAQRRPPTQTLGADPLCRQLFPSNEPVKARVGRPSVLSEAEKEVIVMLATLDKIQSFKTNT